MKYGSIVLLDDKVFVVVIVMFGLVYEKVFFNVQEVKVRNVQLIGVIFESIEVDVFDNVLVVLVVDELLLLMLIVIFLQLLVYYIVVYCGLDVDQLWNLVKLVIVEQLVLLMFFK